MILIQIIFAFSVMLVIFAAALVWY